MPENDPLDDIPDCLNRKKTMTPAAYAAAVQRSKDAVERELNRVPTMPVKAAEKSPLETRREELKKERTRIRVEKLLAKKSGETSKLPPSGREALAIIQADKGSVDMSTTQTTTKGKLPVPPRKSTKSVEKFGDEIAKPAKTGKAALREEAAKAVASNGVTKIEPGVTGRQAKAAAKRAAKAAEKPVQAKKAEKAIRVAPKPAKPGPGRPRGSYDWDQVEAQATSGKIPSLPPLISYAPHMAQIHEAAKKGDVGAVKAVVSRLKLNPKNAAQQKLVRFRDMCLAALKARSK